MTLRETLWLRCNGYCERCGIRLDNSWAMHHRKLKSRGGKNEITNVVALHHHCHNLGTHSVHLRPEEATRQGFIVNSWDDSAAIAITLFNGSQVLLTNEGTYDVVSEGDGNGWGSSN